MPPCLLPSPNKTSFSLEKVPTGTSRTVWDPPHGKQAMETSVYFSFSLPLFFPSAASSEVTLVNIALQAPFYIHRRAVVYRCRPRDVCPSQLTIQYRSQTATPECLLSETLLKQKVHKCPEWIQFSYRAICAVTKVQTEKTWREQNKRKRNQILPNSSSPFQTHMRLSFSHMLATQCKLGLVTWPSGERYLPPSLTT